MILVLSKCNLLEDYPREPVLQPVILRWEKQEEGKSVGKPFQDRTVWEGFHSPAPPLIRDKCWKKRVKTSCVQINKPMGDKAVAMPADTESSQHKFGTKETI